MSTADDDRPAGRLREVAWVLGKLGVIGFGGPAAHIALMRQEMVVRRHWLGDQEFLDLVGTASVLPGPTSTQVGILLGRRRAGWAGLVVGGACFIAPAALIVGVLAWAYVRWGATLAGRGLLYGVKPAVIAVIAFALCGLGRTAIRGRPLLAAGGAAAVAGYLAGVNVLVILVALSGAIAIIDNRRRIAPWLPAALGPAPVAAVVSHGHPGLWSILGEFLKLGCVVIGSGYVLLAFLRQDLVGPHGWITARQLLDAVSVGQFTPGPVFTTATFIGYLAGGVAGAAVATVGIFAPSFVMMSGLAPIVPRLRRREWTARTLDAINVVALGMMAGVAVDLGRSAIVDPLTVLLAVAALVALMRFRVNAAWVLAAGAVAGLVRTLV